MRHKWKAGDDWGSKDQCERCLLIRYKQPFRNTRYFRAGGEHGLQRVFGSAESLKRCTPTEVPVASNAPHRSSE